MSALHSSLIEADIANAINGSDFDDSFESRIEDTTVAPEKPSSGNYVEVSAETVNVFAQSRLAYNSQEIVAQANNQEAQATAEEKKRTRIPIRRIGGGKDFIRVYRNKDYIAQGVRLIEAGTNRELYFVSPNVALPPGVAKEAKRYNIYTAMNHLGEPTLLVISLWEGPWRESALEMMRLSIKDWIKPYAVNADSRYDYYTPTAKVQIPQPKWETLPSFDTMLALAFNGRMISDLNHSVIQRLLGNPVESDGTDEEGF